MSRVSLTNNIIKPFTDLWSNIKSLALLSRYPLLFTVVLSFIMAVVLYREFIFTGTPLFMIAGDGWGQAWPFKAALADYIWTEGLPQWHFGIGLGSNLTLNWLTNPFLGIPIFLGRDIIPYAMVWVQISRIVLACLFFYLLLAKWQFRPYVCSLMSIVYAFCGHMILRGAGWLAYGTEVVVVAFLLYAVEIWYRDKRWALIPVAVCIVGITNGLHSLYLYGLFLFGYATVRYVYANMFKLRDYLAYVAKCGLLYFVGGLMSAVVVLTMFFTLLFSSRGEASVDRIGISFIFDILFQWNQSFLLSAFFRLFSSNTLGTGILYTHGFGGWNNTLESPLNYIGLITILLIPTFFYYANRKLKIIAALGLSFAVFYYFSPAFRFVLNAFIGINHVKLSSFWITIIMVFMASYTLNSIFTKDKKLPIHYILTSCIGALMFFMGFALISNNYGIYVDTESGRLIVLLLSVYTSMFCLFAIGKHLRNRIVIAVFLFFFCIFEVFTFSAITTSAFFDIHARPTMTRYAGRFFLFERDETISAINELDKGFHRVQRMENYFTDPLLHNYFGSASYDSSISPAKSDFLHAIGASGHGGCGFQHSWGLQNRTILQTLTAHKYAVINSTRGEVAPFGYSYLFSVGYRRIYINDHYLPLGFAYDTFVTREQFDIIRNDPELPPEVMDIALLSTVVLETPSTVIDRFNTEQLYHVLLEQIEISNVDEMHFNHMDNIYNNLPTHLNATSYGDDPFVIIPLHSEGGYKNYFITVTVTPYTDTVAQIFWAHEYEMFAAAQSVTHHITGGVPNTLTVELENVNLSSIRIDPGTTPGDYVIENLMVTALDLSQIKSIYTNAVASRRAEAFEIDHFSHNHITGTIETHGERVLFFSIPHAQGWRMYINGERTPIETVNIGFIGATVGAGLHDIELRFRLPGLIAGTIMTTTGIIAYVVLLVLDKKGKLKWLDVSECFRANIISNKILPAEERAQ